MNIESIRIHLKKKKNFIDLKNSKYEWSFESRYSVQHIIMYKKKKNYNNNECIREIRVCRLIQYENIREKKTLEIVNSFFENAR